MIRSCNIFGGIVLILATLTAGPHGVYAGKSLDSDQAEYHLSGTKYFRTELYFGRDKPDGSLVSDDEWKDFLDREVTPRFPDGFTTLDAAGQYRDKSGKIVKEPSKVLVFLYEKKDQKTASSKIDEIREVYCKKFNQESVLRLDFPTSVRVSFE